MSYQQLLAERRAFAEQLGPDRMEMLRHELREIRRQNRVERIAEIQARNQERIQRLLWAEAWRARPHARLTDTALDRARKDADRRAAGERSAADKTRRELAARKPDVTAGRGPRVTELDTRLHQLRVNAERQATAEAIEQRWHQLLKQAAHKEHDAERTSWWQPGKREQLQTEAAALRAVVDKATKDANELATHAAEIQAQLGGRGVWRGARDLAERAEASYERDRDQAVAADRSEITRLERAAEVHDTKSPRRRHPPAPTSGWLPCNEIWPSTPRPTSITTCPTRCTSNSRTRTSTAPGSGGKHVLSREPGAAVSPSLHSARHAGARHR